MQSNALVEKRQELAAKQKELNEVYELAGADLNIGQAKVLEKLGATDAADALMKIKQRNRELDGIGAELTRAELEEVKAANEARANALSAPVRGGAPIPAGELKARTMGEMFAQSDAYLKSYLKSGQRGHVERIDVGLKTIMETGAGFAPESVRNGILVEAATRPLQLAELLPVRPVNQLIDRFMAQTTQTSGSAETAEKGTYGESVFVWTLVESNVRKITDSIPVTDEQLNYAPAMSAIIDSQLRLQLRQRLELQVLVGDGNAPNLAGFLDGTHHASVQSQAKGTDRTFDATYKALTKVRFTGRAQPNAFVMHPNDWQDIRLTTTSTGDYILGNPSQSGANTLWGLPVVLADSITENTALVGDFANYCYVGENRGVDVQIGYIDDQFTTGMKTIRADLSACLSILREAAFCKITGI